jgi:predicted TIM-barrel fold metal-dependent hydrolase
MGLAGLLRVRLSTSPSAELAASGRASLVPNVDIHQHLWPESLIRALERRSEPPRLRRNRLELTVEPAGEVDLDAHLPERRLQVLDRDGIDLAVVSPSPPLELEGHGELADAYHEGIAAVTAASGGRLVPLALAACLPGFAGACVSAETLVSGADALLAELGAAGQFLFVHPGPPAPSPVGGPTWWPAVVHYTAQMQAAYATWLVRDANRFEELQVVFAILAGGGPFQLERMRSRGVEIRTALHDNVYFDTASYGRRAIELCLSTFGVTQLVYGSDTPVIDPGPTFDAVRGFGGGVAELLLDTNPSRVLGRLE